MVVVAATAPSALAHTDPGTDTDTGVGISMRAFRADGVTPVGSSPVTECETIFFQATLNKQPGAVAFEGGEWLIELPDAAACVTDADCSAAERCRDIPENTAMQCAMVVTPAGGIPCIGGTTDDPNLPGGRGGTCGGSDAFIDSVKVQYTVKATDVIGGQVTARSDYRGGFAHLGDDDLEGIGAFTPFPAEATVCSDGQFCNGLETCDPTLTFDTVRLGGCVPATNPCSDNLFCSDVQCNEATDTCDVIPPATDPCPDNLFCSDVLCNETTDMCDIVPPAVNPCPDNGSACADVGCNEDLDRCDVNLDDTACDDQNACTMDRCDAVLGCVHDAIPGCVPCTTVGDCDDGNACTTDTCEADVCVQTPIPGCVPCTTVGDCDDGDACTTDSCEADVCVQTPIPGCVPCTTVGDCDDGNACTTDSCEADVCVQTPIPGCVPCTTAGDCDDGDACTIDTCVGNVCQTTMIQDCIPCMTAEQCDDGNPCTNDLCVDDACSFEPIEGCRLCEVPDDCADGDTCTVDLCLDGVCVRRPPFLAKVRLQFGNQSDIRGSLGVNEVGGDLRLGKTVTMTDGTSATADIMRVGNDSIVWALYANQLAVGRGGIVKGPKGVPTLPIVNPFCSLSTFACGTTNVTIDTRTEPPPLAPGSYGVLRVYNGATLRLAPGTFTFCEIRTGRRATILTTGPTTINVVGNVRIANGSDLLAGPGAPTPIMNVLGSQVRVSAQSSLQAFLTAPSALLTMGRNAILTGTFCVYRTRSDKRVSLICPPDEEPSSPSGSFLD